jgi:DHA2 family multidrug resistance protein
MGRKNFYMLSIIIFTVSSFLCGLSNSLAMMIAARILQGFGGGGLLPIGQAVLLEAFPKEKRGEAMAIFGLVVVMAPIIGPVLGGWITDNWDWPWIFFINVPIGILTLYLTNIFLEDPPYARKKSNVKIDYLGFFLLITWMISLQVILDKGNTKDWFGSPFIVRLSLVFVLSFLLFLISQIKRKDSLLDLSVIKDKNFLVGTFVQVVMMGIILASLSILPSFLQSLMGYTAFLSGVSLMPRGLGGIISLILAGSLSTKVDNRYLAVAGLICVGTGGLMLGNLNMDIAPINIAIPNFIFGLGMGLCMMPLVSLSVITLKNSQMTNASGLQNMVKNIGGAIGTSIVSTIISRMSQVHQAHAVKSLTDLNTVYQTKIAMTTAALSQHVDSVTAAYMAKYSLYGQLIQQSTLWGFIEAFRIVGLVAILIIPLIFLLKKVDFSNKEQMKELA